MGRDRGRSGPRNRNPFELQAQIRIAGKTLAALARDADVHPSTVQTAIYRIQPTGCRIIASFLSESVHDIWPEWFDVHGNVLRRADQEGSVREPAARRQKVSAA